MKTRWQCEHKGCHMIEGHKHCDKCGSGYFPSDEDLEIFSLCGVCLMDA